MIALLLAAQQLAGGSLDAARLHETADPLLSGFGQSVAGVGDLDRDGIPDYAIADPSGAVAGGLPSAGVLHFLAGRDGALLLSMQGFTRSGLFGRAVAAAGDVDGDRYAEVLVGAPGESPVGGSLRGAWHLLSTRTWLVTRSEYSTTDYELLGTAMTGLGDLTGDWRDEFAVAAPGRSGGSYRQGQVLVYSLDPFQPQTWTLDGSVDFGYFGAALARLPDVDGDGRDELLVGESGWHAAGGSEVGRVHALAGGTWTPLWKFRGTDDYGGAGSTLCVIGDLDGDGYDDVLAGAPRSRTSSVYEYGTIYAISGRDGTLIWLVRGAASGHMLGYAMTVVGDLDRDGTQDFVTSDSSYNGSLGSALEYRSGRDGSVLERRIDPWLRTARILSFATIGDLDGDGDPEWLEANPDGPSPSGHASGFALVRTRQHFLDATAAEISAAAGGIVGVSLRFPHAFSGANYRVIFSATGRGPSLVGVPIPLSDGALFQRTLAGLYPRPMIHAGLSGRLDGSASAQGFFAFAHGALTPMIGRTLHAAAVAAPPGAALPQISSTATSFAVVP